VKLLIMQIFQSAVTSSLLDRLVCVIDELQDVKEFTLTGTAFEIPMNAAGSRPFNSSCFEFYLKKSQQYRPVVPKVGGTAPWGGGGITEVGANRHKRWKGPLLLSQGGR
jgi:hypothetical protein